MCVCVCVCVFVCVCVCVCVIYIYIYIYAYISNIVIHMFLDFVIRKYILRWNNWRTTSYIR